MKYILIIFIVVGCSQKPQGKEPYHSPYAVEVEVTEIDSCEYVIATYWSNGISVVHKHNCKFCKARK